MSECTLSEVRKAAYENPGLVFCSSLPLYVLAEKQPRPGEPDYVEVACTVVNGVTGMMLYLSPVDAMIGCQLRNRTGRKYEIFPFEAIDPRAFIRKHDGWFSMYVAFGFAAYDNKLMLDRTDHMRTLLYVIYGKFAPEQIEDHFHLGFGESMMNWLDKIHRVAGLSDYDQLISEQARCSVAELSVIASSALQAADYLDEKACHGLMQCALYDPVEAEWRFIDDIERFDGSVV
jgi:hypothetical protein